jgi:hypothetical protein
MDTKFLIAAIGTTIASACAFAQTTPPSTGVTRAPVIAELAQASFLPYQLAAAATVEKTQAKPEPVRATARACANEAECDQAPARNFTVTRAQVMAEFYRARAAGEIPETEADNDVGHAALRRSAR